MPTTVAPERLVNTVTDGAQRPGDVATNISGTAAVWLDDSGGASVAKLRIFDTSGAPTTAEIAVGAATDVAVAKLGDGFFVVRVVQVGPQQVDIVAQAYSARGAPVGAAVTLDTTDVRNTPTLSFSSRGLEVSSLADGGVVVGWSNSSAASTGQVSLSAEYVVVDRQGVVEAHETLMSESGRALGGSDVEVAFTELAGERILATYRVHSAFTGGPPGPTPGQFAQLIDAAGRLLGAPVRLDATTPTDGAPAIDATAGVGVGALPNGEVVFAWLAEGTVYISRYSTDQLGLGLATRTAPMRLTATAGAGEPQVVVMPDGRFAVGWNADGEVVAQVFSLDGQTVGALLKLGTVSAGVQDELRLALSPSGVLAAIWQDPSGQAGAGGGADPSGPGVKLALISLTDGPLAGGPGADTLVGGPGNDILIGNPGDDVLVGAGGDDTLMGGVGGDSLSGGTGFNLIDGGSNTDFVTYAGAPGAVVVDLQAGTGGAAGLQPDRLVSIEAVYGSAFGDVLRGSFLSNLIAGKDGADTLVARSGTDYVDGGAGNDLIELDGSVSDYFVINQAGGARVIGPFGVTTVVDVERVRLANGSEMNWSDFAARAFDGLRYVASNPDLIASIGTNVEAARQHWMTTGQAQGRSLDSFDPLRYAASNTDLLQQFYIDTQALSRHYITTGFAQGRSATSFDPIQYGAINNDLLLAFGADPAALTRHYAVSGFIEGRPKTGFDPPLYGASNNDLARVFGTDADALLRNWVNSGVFEGRPTTGFDALQYAAANDDLARLFGTDQQAALRHWLTTGADEFRPTTGFDATAYVLSYAGQAPELTFQTALNHWLTVGADAGLLGDELFGREQDSHTFAGLQELKNFTTSGRFHADRDWFQISAGGAVTARISVSGADGGKGTLADPRIELYDAAGRFLAADEDSGPGRDALFIIPGGGRFSSTYYVVVRSADGGEGTYTVSIEYGSGLSAPDDGWII